MRAPSVQDHVCLSSIDWDYLWQGNQELMTRFAKEGSRVLFVENTGVRRPRLADRKRLVARARAAVGRRNASAPTAVTGITIVSPLVIPLPWSSPARRVNRAIFASRLPRRAADLGLRSPIVWTFLPTPLALDSMRAFGGARHAAVYYCGAEFELLADDPRAAVRSELELLQEVDVVFAHTRSLQQRLAQHHPRAFEAPFAVGDQFFEAGGPVPPEMVRIPRPRVGYVGGIHRHIDVELVSEVVARMPDVHFVFIGPNLLGNMAVSGAPNAHFLGKREYLELPMYVDAFDVCIVPYRRSRVTDTMHPTKIREYLARGKPVVSTPLAEVTLQGYDHSVVRTAGTAEEMTTAIRSALATAPDVGDRRRAIAERYSWRAVTTLIRHAIDDAVTAPTAASRSSWSQ